MSQESNHSRWLAPIERLAELAPLYVAYPLATFLRDYAQTPRIARLALFSLCDSVEAVVRFLSIARSLELISKNGKAPGWLARTAAANLVTPTFGQWINLLTIIIDHEKGKSQSDLLPELATLDLRSELFAKSPAREDAERHDLLKVRNPIAHGSSISEAYAHELLEYWAPKIAPILDRLRWLGEIELWARDAADGFRRLNGPQVDGSPEEPPASICDALQHPGAVALIRKGHVVKLHPLGRKLPYRNSDRYLAQIFARRDKPGLIYHLFGAENALQSVSTLTELKHLDEIFDIQSVRSEQKQTLFGEYNYDNEFESDADAFIGRADALDVLWQTVIGAPKGIIFVAGPAGIGKSSLIAQIWKDLRDEIEDRRARKQTNELLLAYRFIDGDRGCTSQSFLIWLIVRTRHRVKHGHQRPVRSADRQAAGDGARIIARSSI